jgi:hypothetical protein
MALLNNKSNKIMKALEQFEDPDQKEFELTLSKTILAMPEEV